ncbi:MAG: aminotransferase class V-fold PLP-dependent enzyme [Pseudomonadota bacterium]
MSLSYGRDHVAIPGPSVIPDRVLRAMHRPAPNIYEGDLIDLSDTIYRDLPRLAGTEGNAVIYIGNGHAAWEAAIANMFAPGDTALVLSTGRFALGWAEMARRLGVEIETLDFGFRAAFDPAKVSAHLSADKAHKIRAILTVQTDTASSAMNDLAALRRAIDAADHPALLMVDSIASFACEPMEMDKWGVDVLVAGCQKGLMTPPGIAFNFVGPRAWAERRPCASTYWDWASRIEPEWHYQRFCGTSPTHHLYGLREALDMIDEEGLPNTLLRHERLARAVWVAVESWGQAGGIELNIAAPAERSRAVTTLRSDPGDAAKLRAWCEETTGLVLGLGLPAPNVPRGSLFRIGHMGHLNAPMLLGALATIEAGLGSLGIPHAPGGAQAALQTLSTAPAEDLRIAETREKMSGARAATV